MTLSNIDALDSTTKATIEATIFASDIGSTRTLTAYASASSNKVESGAIAIPAGSLISKIIAIITTQLEVTDTNNNTTIKVGTVADEDQIASKVNIQASGLLM